MKNTVDEDGFPFTSSERGKIIYQPDWGIHYLHDWRLIKYSILFIIILILIATVSFQIIRLSNIINIGFYRITFYTSLLSIPFCIILIIISIGKRPLRIYETGISLPYVYNVKKIMKQEEKILFKDIKNINIYKTSKGKSTIIFLFLELYDGRVLNLPRSSFEDIYEIYMSLKSLCPLKLGNDFIDYIMNIQTQKEPTIINCNFFVRFFSLLLFPSIIIIISLYFICISMYVIFDYSIIIMGVALFIHLFLLVILISLEYKNKFIRECFFHYSNIIDDKIVFHTNHPLFRIVNIKKQISFSDIHSITRHINIYTNNLSIKITLNNREVWFVRNELYEKNRSIFKNNKSVPD